MRNPRITPKEPRKDRHTVESTQKALENKNLAGILTVISINYETNLVIVNDKDYGKYQVDLKSFAPKSAVPVHPLRKRQNRLNQLKEQLIKTGIKGVVIKDVFYGPDRGFKSRGFHCEYVGLCGHVSTSTPSILKKYSKTLSCIHCKPGIHGHRKRVDGVLIKRTSTYTYWVNHNKKLPQKYQEFTAFLQEVGPKPHKKAKIIVDQNKKVSWSSLAVSEKDDTNTIATAIRQAFRNSSIFKDALNKARVETEAGPRYQCNKCKNLYMRKYVQIDHIDPIMPISGEPIKRSTLIDRIFTKNIQILDLKCHRAKSGIENSTRAANKRKGSI